MSPPPAISSAEIEPLLARPLISRPLALNHGFSGEAEDERVCNTAIRHGSRSFHLASLLLPRSTRRAARALYAFCRHSDDLIDEPNSGLPALMRLRHRLARIYSGTPEAYACDRAFARVVESHCIPKPVVSALLEGFEMDLSGCRYRSIDDLKVYATNVASSVGVMMAMVMGVQDQAALARAADLGIAMQLTNIARDVGEDARNGRLYLPLDWLAEAGIDPGIFLKRPSFSPGLGHLVERLLQEAERHYRLGHAGVAALPPECRRAIRAAALIYEAIGHEIAAAGFDTVTRRAKTSLPTKLRLLVRAGRAEPRWAETTARDMTVPCEPASAPLVSIAAAALQSRRGTEPLRTAPTAGASERLTTILLSLHANTREELHNRRLAAREKVARLA
ncbi:phytoene/squalene synthase family protein [Rhizobium sp. G187]|uniref:phytoene/squalene synthase family protein n=1 Tax=Rhizobium sp. G187 TaxID=3451352 RepID=UPI003EE4E48E